jgi:transposase
MVYVGVDLHRKTSQVAAVDEQGKLILNRNIRSDRDELLRVFGEVGHDQALEVAFEATYGWGWFADLLEDVGIPTHMAHPRANKAISSARVKNDAVDAKTLAHLLRTGLLPESWIAPPEIREGRRLVRMRTAMVRIRSRLKNQVHAILADRGLHPEGSDIFAGDLTRMSRQLPSISRQRVEANLRLIGKIDEEVDLADAQIHKLFARDAGVRRLLPIPGVGIITAAIVVAEVGDIHRFPTARHFGSWCGLTPTEHSSAEHTRRGHISKQGSRWLRWVLVEAACHAYRNPELAGFQASIASRRGDKIARVALARRIATLCFHALRSPQGCRAFPVHSR